ncbi:cysteine desulfurase family protein [Lapidilactobacillus wuchangensis]|uniref:cysteine desulfurase family protein n=1 Tax=Lapidilactobacillus wuchangensis TaxID=2486001 RepID=UPI000F7886CE|nr:cysteine desulfurase family protein [Lapidilactobacillus wuchangensis]
MIYFDNSATTKIDPQVLQTYQTVANQFWGNPSSLHHLGDQALQMLQSARQQIADLMHCQAEEIFFTSGGTEGDNWVLKGTAMAKQEFGRHIIVSSIEHPAVLNSAKQLEKLGWDVTYLPVDAHGYVHAEDVKKALRKDTVLVSVMGVNNEIGTVQPIREIAEVLKDRPTIHFHVDAVQTVGKNLFDQVLPDRVDFATFSGHKFHGPRGVGFVYIKKGRKLAPLITGGGQERNWRSGTENVPAIAAMSKAFRLVLTDEAQKAAQQMAMRQKLLTALQAMPDITIFSPTEGPAAPHILCFALSGVRGETMVHALEEHDIYLSTTSACSSRTGDESGTLKAMQVPEKLATSAVRISLDDQNTMAEVDQFLTVFPKVYQRFQHMNGRVD